MRIALTEPMRVRQVERSKRLNCALARLRPAHQSMADRALTDLVKKTHRRIERRRSALGNIGDARTTYAAPPSGIEATQISSPQQDASADVTYAVGIDPAGKVIQVEVLETVPHYDQIKHPLWCAHRR